MAACTWMMTEAQSSVSHGAGRPSSVLRMSSEVCFARGRGERHQQAAPILQRRGRGWRRQYFFFSWSPEVRRPLPAVQAGGLPSPPTLARASSRRRRARPNHSSRHRWLRIRRGLVRRPGPERSDGAFDVCRPRPAPPGSTCRRRRRLCPYTGGQPLLPEAPASIPPDSAPRGGRAGQEATAAAARRNQPRPGPGAQPAAAEGRPPRGRGPGIR